MAPDPIPILIGFRFDYICQILCYDEEYTRKVWSHYSCSATYPKPDRTKEVYEHVIAPADKGVSAKSEDGALLLVGPKAEKALRGLASSGGISRPQPPPGKFLISFLHRPNCPPFILRQFRAEKTQAH